MVERNFRRAASVVIAAAAALVIAGCSGKDIRNETIGSANGSDVKVYELREFLGIRGGIAPASQVPVEKKKEALDRLLSGRLLEQEARARGLDNTSEYKESIERNRQGILISALFRKEMDSRLKLKDGDVKEEAKKLREVDKNLSEADASFRARQALSEAEMRRIEEDLIAASRKEIPVSVNRDLIGKIGSGAAVGDNAVLATAGEEKIVYGDLKKIFSGVPNRSHGGQDLSRNTGAIERVLDREVTGAALAAYAKKKGIEGTEWAGVIRKELERTVLINLIAEKIVPKDVSVTDKEVADAYVEHGKMFVRDGRKIPLAEVRGQILAFLQNRKRNEGMEKFVEGLKKNAKITVNEALLPKV